MTFTDRTAEFNRLLGPDAFALFLKSSRADITVQGDGDLWLIVVFELDAEGRSHVVLRKELSDRDTAISMAHELARVMEEDWASVRRLEEFVV